MGRLGERQRPAASRGKEDLLEAASRVVADRGFDQTRFSDVSRAAGVTISTLQYSFGSREDLLIAALDHAHLKELEGLREGIGTAGVARDRLDAFIDYAYKGGTEGGHVAWLIWLESLRGAPRIPHLSDLATEVQEEWLAVLREILEQGVEQGEFALVDVESSADQVLAIVNGLAVAEILRGGKKLDVAMRRAKEAAAQLLPKPPPA